MPRTQLDSARLRRLARQKFGYESLRPGQEQVIRLVAEGHDVLSIMPTGSGKSAIYQMLGLLLEGSTVIVSPLIALQKDQIDAIEEKNLPEAAAVNSNLPESERREAFEELEKGELEYLFLSPEQLSKEETLAPLRENHPSLFVVDEAHCVSEWGHDFRPDYLRLGKVIENLAHPRVLALTATASPAVRDDIAARLGMRDPKVVVWGFDRPNLRLEVERCEEEADKQRVLLSLVRRLPRPGIIYVATRGHAEGLADLLQREHIKAEFYHAGLPAAERTRIQDRFMAGRDAIIVATNAFGLGVDKPDVRFVIHYDVPDSMDAYYQEIGRAGRDGEPATATLLFRQADAGRQVAMSSPGRMDREKVEKVAEAVQQSEAPVGSDEVAAETGLPPGTVDRVLNELDQVGAVELEATGQAVPAHIADPTEAADKVTEEHENLRSQRRGRVDLMRDYAETQLCRRKFILEYFGEPYPGRCGNCDNCQTGASARAQARNEDLPFPLKSRVRHRKWGEGVVMRYDSDNVVVLFDKAGTKELSTKLVVDRGLLKRVNAE